MLSVVSHQPVNLTAAADLAGLLDACGTAQVLARSRLAFSLHGIDDVAAIVESAETDILYIIISGYGVMRCADGERVEFTAGDVMLVPTGALHRFEEISPKFRTWRIVVGRAETEIVDDGLASPMK